ncbi:MAG: alpha/beta hydrolase [Ketobacteraceae bacterium]|nr:alpha/beta hydrolase [Ketobacteraceae bacterium]
MSRLTDLTTLVRLSKSYLTDIRVDRMVIDNETISYLEAGDRRNLSILFIHAFNGTKNLWRLMLDRLKHHYHVIAPELPVYSCTSDPKDERKYNFRYLMDLLEQFIALKGLSPLHLVGASAGSTMAAHLMLKHPDKIETLAMFAMPTLFREEEGAEAGQLPPPEFYLPITVEGFEALKHHLVYDPPPTSDWIMSNLARRNREQREVKLKILEECINRTAFLVPRLRQIDVPTLFLYGEGDRVTPQHTIDHFVQEVPNIQHFSIKRCGHLPYLEKADEVAATYLSFLAYCRSVGQPDTRGSVASAIS